MLMWHFAGMCNELSNSASIPVFDTQSPQSVPPWTCQRQTTGCLARAMLNWLLRHVYDHITTLSAGDVGLHSRPVGDTARAVGAGRGRQGTMRVVGFAVAWLADLGRRSSSAVSSSRRCRMPYPPSTSARAPVEVAVRRRSQTRRKDERWSERALLRGIS